MGGCRQEGVVLPSPPPRLPSNRTAAAAHRASSAAYRAGRSLQLRRWFRKLASRGVSGKEGVVLQSPRQGLSESRRWLCDVLQAIRLQCWFRKLDGGLVRGQEGLVLQERRQGLPTSSWWVCLEVALTYPGNDSAARSPHMFSPDSCSAGIRAIFRCATSAFRRIGSKRRVSSSAGIRAIFRCWTSFFLTDVTIRACG